MTNHEPFAARQVRAAVSESASRDENERSEDARGASDSAAELAHYTCECAQECAAIVSLTIDEYEEIRSVATHFLAAPSHLVVGVEVVVRETPRYLVVEKIGAAAAVAARLDRRASPVRTSRAA